MEHNTLKKLLEGKYRDNDSGKYIKLPDVSVVIEQGVRKNIRELVTSLDIGKNFCVVSDANTHGVLGFEAEQALGFNAVHVTFYNGIDPDINAVNSVVRMSKHADAIIAVGSGTINDICKYASFISGKPYAVFGTAPSMNGYGSANASITIDGHKKTLKAHMPKGIFLDLDVLSSAPQRLIRSGLGDSLCRPAAQSDWLLSHLVLGTEYKTTPFELLKPYEADLFANSAELMKGDPQIIKLLAETIIISGFGMYICGGSYPASQGEHMIAHTMEIVYGAKLLKTFHGEEIGVTTLTMAKMQEDILKSDFLLEVESGSADNIAKFFGHQIGAECLAEYHHKMFDKQKIDEINAVIEKNRDEIRSRIAEVMISPKILEKTLKKAGAPVLAKELGWDNAKYKQAVLHAKYMRNRFTFLDLS